jgi:cytidylate kinase
VEFAGQRILLDGDDVTDAIRTEDVSAAASRIAALPALRDALLWRQRAFRAAPGLVAEGRDMGSVVFPDAKLKVFVTASVETRPERRYKQLIGKGMNASLPALSQEIAERDARDSERAVAPLAQPQGALPIDTTELTADEVRDRVLAWWEEANRATSTSPDCVPTRSGAGWRSQDRSAPQDRSAQVPPDRNMQCRPGRQRQ